MSKLSVKKAVSFFCLFIAYNISAQPNIDIRTSSLAKYAKENGYNESILFLIDMKIDAAKFRFFVYDTKLKKIINKGLVSHGSGSVGKDNQLVFSNKVGSNATSLGRYKIGKSYYGKFGHSYKLHGLDNTNNNAYKRAVVLHSYPQIADLENPTIMFYSWGCPTVSPNFLKKLEGFITQSKKPILLEIYY